MSDDEYRLQVEGPLVIYLALPPAVFDPVVEAIIEAGAGEENRIVVEKPLGEGLESTRPRNGLQHRCFPEESVFRIDHFLGHQAVQNLLGIRFGNRIFEPLWNPNHAERVEIRFDETLAQIVLPIDNWRWAGVPSILRSGKALERNRQEIVIRFRDVPFHAFGKEKPPGSNVLRLAFEPDRMALDLNLNGANDPFELEPAPQRLPAYARLLLDLRKGDPTLSIRADDAEESWRIVEPVVDAWSGGMVLMQSYPAGSSFEP